MFRIEMLPAREGDCLWITYGDPAKPRTILIDGGRKATSKEVRKRLTDMGPTGELELLIISHIDRDHIEGILALFETGGLGVKAKDIWFNAYQHLMVNGLEPFGAAQGEKLSLALQAPGTKWNQAFAGGSVCVTGAALPVKPLDGDMKVTLLSPTPQKLAELEPVWKKECIKAGLMPGAKAKPDGAAAAGLEHFGAINVKDLANTPFKADGSEPNGSSIAVMLEHDGKKVILAADAHADVMTASIKTLGKGAPLKLNAYKLAHHGSAANTSLDLLKQIDCDHWLVSTNGSYFEHPDQAAVARLIKGTTGARNIYFNYRSDFTNLWDDPTRMGIEKYLAHYPAKNGWQTIDL